MKDDYSAYIRTDFVDAVSQRMTRIGVTLFVGEPYPSYAKFVMVAIPREDWMKLSVEERSYWFDNRLSEKD
jgi:hypothetical protein